MIYSFLANENYPFPSIKLIRAAGYTVEAIKEISTGISDSEVMAYAQLHRLIILTFDADYGELIYKYALQNPPAVIYFRSKGSTPVEVGEKFIELLNSGELLFENRFTVIDKDGIRQRVYE